MTNRRPTSPDLSTPAAALIAAERKATATDEPKWRTAEARWGAILAALDGWTLVPSDEITAKAVIMEWALGYLEVNEGTVCRFDHHGGCQAHGYLTLDPGEECPEGAAQRARAALAESPK